MGRIAVLTFVHYYLPGFRSGGPVRTLANMVDAIGGDFDFRIVTSDRDFNNSSPYPEIEANCWLQVGKARVWYARPETQGITHWARIMRQTSHNVLYLNSLFDPSFTIRPLVVHKLSRSRVPVILAPRGELSPGALRLKRLKKKVFLLFAKPLRLYNGVTWQASSEEEEKLIQRHFGHLERVWVARNISSPPIIGDIEPMDFLKAEGLRIAFLSRVSRMKNLEFALNVLRSSPVPVRFDIWGIMEDKAYWKECKRLIDSMPGNVQVRYLGEADPGRVLEILAGYDLLFLPTLGENYAHVVAESLSAGTPVLISDQTPWRGLAQKGVGWDLSLKDKAAFVRVIKELAELDPGERAAQRRRAREFARKVLEDPKVIEANRRLFLAVAEPQGLGTRS